MIDPFAGGPGGVPAPALHLRIARCHPRCDVLGPGHRFAVWVQGCTLGCPGCIAPETHDPLAGVSVSVASLLGVIRATSGIEGVTISGGEPFQQPEALASLLSALHLANLGTIVYTGFTVESLRSDPVLQRPLAHIDLLVDGPFAAGHAVPLRIRGSSNQRLIALTGRYRDWCDQPEAEPPRPQLQMAITAHGQAWWMGIPNADAQALFQAGPPHRDSNRPRPPSPASAKA